MGSSHQGESQNATPVRAKRNHVRLLLIVLVLVADDEGAPADGAALHFSPALVAAHKQETG